MTAGFQTESLPTRLPGELVPLQVCEKGGSVQETYLFIRMILIGSI